MIEIKDAQNEWSNSTRNANSDITLNTFNTRSIHLWLSLLLATRNFQHKIDSFHIINPQRSSSDDYTIVSSSSSEMASAYMTTKHSSRAKLE